MRWPRILPFHNREDAPSVARRDARVALRELWPEAQILNICARTLAVWNNIRMAFETLAVLAHATGRVLVMLPQRLYY